MLDLQTFLLLFTVQEMLFIMFIKDIYFLLSCRYIFNYVSIINVSYFINYMHLISRIYQINNNLKITEIVFFNCFDILILHIFKQQLTYNKIKFFL